MISSVQIGFGSSRAVFFNCMNSPSTRFAITVASNSTTSASRNRARATEARPSRKSPARTAILLPKAILTLAAERREVEESMTSSWRRDAVWMSSVISARRRCKGRIPESSDGCGPCVCLEDKGFREEEGLTSARTAGGVMGLSIAAADWKLGSRVAFGVRLVALDIRRTRSGRMCLPSDCV